MVVISGHSPRFGYVNLVQEYIFGKACFSIILQCQEQKVQVTSVCNRYYRFETLEPQLFFLNIYLCYSFTETRSWSIASTKGFPFSGRYGHSSSWDPLTRQIYVFGGYSIGSGSEPTTVSNSMFSYDPFTYTW